MKSQSNSFIFYGKYMIKKTLKGYFKGYNKDTDTVDFIASSGSEDREGEVIDPKGWDLNNIGKNLPLLWAHDARELPIGKVVEARMDGDNLITSVKFAHKVNDFAKKVYDLVKAGFLNAVSVGFMPKAYNDEGKMINQELLELSVVNVPANQDALISNEYQAFTKTLKEMDEKEKHIISEKHRNALRIARDSINELLDSTKPPAKKGGVKITEQINTPREKRVIKAVQLIDKIGEAIIHEFKEGGEKK